MSEPVKVELDPAFTKFKLWLESTGAGLIPESVRR
jgi:hypothetical protein